MRAGYSRAEGMMVLLRAEMDFLIGVISVATGTTLIIALVEGGKVVGENREIIQRLPAVVAALLAARKVFKQVAPNLYSYIFDTLLGKMIANLPLATAKAAASIVVARYAGKLVGSLGWNGFQSKTTKVKKASKVILSFIAFKGIPGAAMAVKDDYAKLGIDLITALRKIGAAALSEPNALGIIKEIMTNKKVIREALEVIIAAVEGIEKRRGMSAAEIAKMNAGLEIEAELFRKAPPGAF
jgi:hypothetical protein